MSRVASKTVFTFEKAELEQMVREAVTCPEGMCFDYVNFVLRNEFDDEGDPLGATFERVEVNFTKLKPGR